MNLSHLKKVKDTASILFSKDQIEQALDTMAFNIDSQHQNTNPLVLCVVIGGIVTLGQLITRAKVPLQIDYVHASRYNGETTGSKIKWHAKPRTSLANRNIIIVDDILDGGLTLSAIIKYCIDSGAKSVETAVLLDKKNSRETNGLQKATYTGLYLSTNDYVFGFGMDYHNYLRNTEEIYALDPALLPASQEKSSLETA